MSGLTVRLSVALGGRSTCHNFLKSEKFHFNAPNGALVGKNPEVLRLRVMESIFQSTNRYYQSIMKEYVRDRRVFRGVEVKYPPHEPFKEVISPPAP